MLCAFCSAAERSSSSSSSRVISHRLPGSFGGQRGAAHARRILANAVSRLVEVSSQKGEKPQSSVVPSCATGMYSAASSTRSRTSFGVSMRGSIGAIDADEDALVRLQVLAG